MMEHVVQNKWFSGIFPDRKVGEATHGKREVAGYQRILLYYCFVGKKVYSDAL